MEKKRKIFMQYFPDSEVKPVIDGYHMVSITGQLMEIIPIFLNQIA